MKKILNILFLIGVIFLFINNSFALDAKITLDKNNSDINNPINLRVEIISSKSGKISITKIKGLENFKKISQSQSQSNSSEIVIINGKTKKQNTTTINLDLSLEGQKSGEFEIGPAILQMGTGTIETNSVKVKITGNKIQGIGIGNKVLPIQKKPQLISPKKIEVEETDKKQKIETYKIKKNNNELYLFFGVLLLLVIGFYFIIKSKSEQIESNTTKENDRDEFLTKYKNENNNNKIDFEEEKIEIKFPEINDKEFIKKSEIALRKKLKQKFKIKNINNLTFKEIQYYIGDKLDLKELFDMINKIKYSNIITDNSKILEKIKEI